MLRNSLFAVAAILGATALAAMAADPAGTVPFHPQRLVPAQGVQLYQPIRDPYMEGGVILAATTGGAPVELSPKNTGEFFPKVSSGQEAMELCRLLGWGTLVESEDAFAKVVAAYEKAGFKVAKVAAGAGTDTAGESWQREGKMQFDAKAEAAGEGFEVAFTAFLLNRGMGVPASINRLTYTVGKDGTAKLKENVRYLQGPTLNWQTEGMDAAEEKKNDQQYDKRRQLIQAVYGICPNLIPQGRKTRSLADFQPKLDKALTPAAADAAFGKPDGITGSGLLIYVYLLSDGRALWLGFPGYQPILYAKVKSPDGKLTDLELK
jgi:hypothetical protein